ncbi:hypothetical protein ACN5R1_002865, partial [Shigella flexneri]
MADYAEINNFPPELSSSGDKYFHLRNGNAANLL